MRTFILVEVEHVKALPSDLTDNVANKIWTTLYNKDVRCEVTAQIWKQVEPQMQRWMEVK